MSAVTVVGAGLAGSECAWQLARRGIKVRLVEMKPGKYSPAHVSPGFAELVCSNSLRSDELTNAVGLLKEELRRLGSLIMESADKNRVAAGGALAVDREGFSEYITQRLRACPNVEVEERELTEIPEGEAVIATGPLTSDAMAEAIVRLCPEFDLHFYDAVAPIVTLESVDMENAYLASRYGKGTDDYVNCPMTKEEYEAFVTELRVAKEAPVHGFDDGAVFEGCMPVEVMARRGFAVTVFEKEEKAGGQVKTASTCLLKGKLYWSIEDLMANVEKLGVEVKLGTEATEKAIAKLKPYAVVIATGGVPVRPRSIKGIDLPNVCTAPEIIMGEKKISGKIVAVIGSGMTGLETTEILNESGNHVVVVEMAEEIAPGTWFQLKDDELSRIQKYDTEFMPGKRLMKITEDSVILEDVRTSMLTTVTVDEVVLSLGVRPVNALAKALENQYPYVVTVGDACKSGRIADAVHSAYDAVMRIK